MEKMITQDDILDIETFMQCRPQWRQDILALKKDRRVTLGPEVTCYFENRQTLLWQIQEMLYIEKGGAEQIEDELAAYAPLEPNGNEWVATVMIEIPDPIERALKLSQLGHFEFSLVLKFVGHEVVGKPEDDQERTTAEGKTSSVHFIRWTFTQEQKDLLRQENQDVILESRHPNYLHKTVLSDKNRTSLCFELT
jgi:hypothetical protein